MTIVKADEPTPTTVHFFFPSEVECNMFINLLPSLASFAGGESMDRVFHDLQAV